MYRIRFWALALVSFITAIVATFFVQGAFWNRVLSIAYCTIFSVNSTFCAAYLGRSAERAMAANPPVFARTMQMKYDPSKYVAAPNNTSSQRLAQSVHPADGAGKSFPKEQTLTSTRIDYYDEKKFENCNALVKHFEEVRKQGGLIAETIPALKIKDGKIKVSRMPDGKFQAEQNVIWEVDQSKSLTRLPKYTWSNMTDAEKAALKDAMDALRVHEEGHIKVAEDYAREISGSVSADGSTYKEAVKNLRDKIQDSLKEVKAELDKRGFQYDQVTEHGLKQSQGPSKGFPGGKDVYLKCPEKKREGNYKQGRSYGEPHLITFDGLSYSFQTVGEFILVKSNDGKFEVQVRHAPVNSSLSLNSAVAMKVGSDRVAFYSKEFPDSNTSTPLRINGKPTVIQGDSLSLPGGNTIAKSGDTYVVNFSTGEKVVVDTAQVGGNFYFNVSPFVLDSQPEHYSGLLGNVNGNPKDDQKIRGGGVLSSKSTYGDVKQVLNLVGVGQLPVSLDAAEKLYFDQLYKDFANSWRISQKESLFDYLPNKTTENYTDRKFPDKYLKLEMLSSEQVKKARSTCEAAKVTQDMMEGCIFDVGFTGFSEFARATAEINGYVETLNTLFPGINIPTSQRVIDNTIERVKPKICAPFVGCL